MYVIEKQDLKKLLKKASGEDANRGCYIDGKWLKVSEIIKVMDKLKEQEL